MALSISMLGIMILFGLIQDVKSILHYVVTFGLVFYFSVSDGWRDGYYNAAVTAGRTIGMIIGSNLDYENIHGIELADGCDYYIDADGITSSDDSMAFLVIMVMSIQIMKHIMQFGMLMIVKWKSFLVVSMLANLVVLRKFGILLFRLGVSGILLFMSLVILIMLFMFFTVQFLIFALSAFFVLTLLVFISPVIIPLALLKNVQKARGIFETWLKTLIAYSFQPMIVWSILAILSVVIDIGLYGDGKDVLMRIL